jgi:putative phosphoesterase
MRVVVVSDTHIPDFAKALPSALLPELRRADLILHAGDVSAAAVLDELAAFAPVHVALGNKDRPDVTTWGARPEVLLEIDGVSLAMVHDSGPRQGRERRLTRRFPGTRVIVFGHSHIPIDAEADGVRFLNPGSPTWKRRQPAPTYGIVTISDGRMRTRILELP